MKKALLVASLFAALVACKKEEAAAPADTAMTPASEVAPVTPVVETAPVAPEATAPVIDAAKDAAAPVVDAAKDAAKTEIKADAKK